MGEEMRDFLLYLLQGLGIPVVIILALKCEDWCVNLGKKVRWHRDERGNSK